MLKGIYVLIIRLNNDAVLRIGALGEVPLMAGVYAYVGSAQTNLEQRVKRHLRKDKRLFWHIDYLLDSDHAKVIKIFYRQADKRGECMVANEICAKGEPVNGFGCSDCNCISHLFRIDEAKFLCDSMQEISMET